MHIFLYTTASPIKHCRGGRGKTNPDLQRPSLPLNAYVPFELKGEQLLHQHVSSHGSFRKVAGVSVESLPDQQIHLCKAKMFNLAAYVQTKPLTRALCTSSWAWLTAHMPTNQVGSSWAVDPLAHPWSTGAIVQLFNNYLTQIHTCMKLLKGITHWAHNQDLVTQPSGQQEDTSAIAPTRLGEIDYTPEGFLPRPDFHKEVMSTKTQVPQTSSKSHYSCGMFRHCWVFRAQTLRVKILYVLRWTNSHRPM